jgi:3-oxoacyl-[acyl-carrier-protein] synthase-3
MIYSKIAGTGSFLPNKILTNHDLEKIVDTSHEWIVERSGIEQRHIAEEKDDVVSMSIAAAKEALSNASMTAAELDLIIIATCTPPNMFPSCACAVQAALGATQAAAFDISAACSGFIYGMATADNFIKAGSAKNVLVVGAEVISRSLNWEDRTTCVLFGDGAGAAILSASEAPGILATRLKADGNYGDVLYMESGLTEEAKPFIKMQGREVFKLAVTQLTNTAINILQDAGLSVSDIDWVVPHQANNRIIKMIISKLNLPDDKVITTVAQHANTSSASIPLALHQAISDGRIQRGQTLLLEAFGGGLTWGSAILKY